jgi:hypothetical protein
MMRDGRTDLARQVYGVVRGERPADEMRALLTRLSGKPEAAAAFADRLESLGDPTVDSRPQEITS